MSTPQTGAPLNATRPRVLFVYYTYTQQTLKVTEAMAEVLRDRGCEVHQAEIELIDPRYAARFNEFPMPHPFREVLGMIPAELRRVTGEISVPNEVSGGGDYDLVCIGSPTWWLSTSVPVRSFLRSEDATRLLAGRQFAAFVVCRRYLGPQSAHRKGACDETRRSVPRCDPLLLPRRPNTVFAVAAELPRDR